MARKALFFDIDGTLVDVDNGICEVPQAVLDEFARLQAAGHKLFASSGRPRPMLMGRQFQDVSFDGLVLMNGAYVEVAGKSVYEEKPDLQLMVNAIDMLEGLGCEYMIETADRVYIDPSYTALRGFFVEAGLGDIFTFDFDKDEVLREAIKVEANADDEDRQHVEEHLQRDFGYVLNFDTHGTANSFEFFSPKVSKANGIERTLAHLGISREDSYAFGDGTNDIEMLEYCGVGVAMGNASDEVKAHADVVAPPVAQTGLATILRELIP